jgi:MscS family membrane protein
MTLLTTIQQWITDHPNITHLIIVVLITLLLHVVFAFSYKHFFAKLSQEKHVWPVILLNALRKPLVVLIWYLAIIYALLDIFKYIDNQEALPIVKTAMRLGMTLICLWFLLRVIKFAEQTFIKKRGHHRFDRTTIDGISKVARITLFCIAVLAVLQTLGVPLAAIYTAAGGAGIGITLAAQDMLKNFFGGLVLYFDRPFSIGDWISSPDRNIEGTVEKIGWRTTRIRTFDKRPLYVPNSTFLTVSVENPSRMQHRRLLANIGVRYDDFRVVAKITQQIEAMLRKDEDIVTDDSIWVNLVELASSSLTFRVYCFTKTTEWIPFQKIQQRILLNILEIITDNGAEAAFPTETLHIPDGLIIKSEEHSNVTTPTN